jgi:sulfur transfer complex TusBCD TusB component (DsrH family)
MAAKKIVQEFYKSDALIDPNLMQNYLHPEVILDWQSSKGFLQLNFSDIIVMTDKLSKAYIRSKAKVTHLLQDGARVAVHYSHYIKTIENPREDVLLAHFAVVWELKDNLLFRGYQLSQLP